MLAFFTGFLLGAGHVVSGPDHLAAVSPMADGPRAWRAGAAWGFGHAVGVGLVALGLWALGRSFELEQVGAAGERLVGLSLIAVGAWGLFRARWPKAGEPRPKRGGPLLWIGLLHGLAGASHLYAAMPALVVASGTAYLVGFGAGAIVAMAAFASGVGRILGALSSRAHRRATIGLSALTLIVGAIWLVIS